MQRLDSKHNNEIDDLIIINLYQDKKFLTKKRKAKSSLEGPKITCEKCSYEGELFMQKL